LRKGKMDIGNDERKRENNKKKESYVEEHDARPFAAECSLTKEECRI